MIEWSKRKWLGWFAGKPLHPRMHLLLGLILPAYVMGISMWRVRAFTVDDAYISFRYARNLVDGHGLVYNIGERVEGYTNFLWTLLCAGGLELGIDPHVTSKWLGALAAMGTLVLVYKISARIRPLGRVPCVATWMLATSPTFDYWAVFGLETSLFSFLVTLGVWMMFEEHAKGRGVPWSGVVFGLAGLTRPEAPMYIGLAMLLLGRGFFGRQNIVRGIIFTIPLAVHLLWRHDYYGAWLPSTLDAKTGDLKSQFRNGKGYVQAWISVCGPMVFLAMYAAAVAIIRKHRELATMAVIGVAVGCYVILVGGDWMSYYRFMAPAEPFVFVCVCVAFRELGEIKDRAAVLALALLTVWQSFYRDDQLRDARRKFLREEKKFWDKAAGRVADWLLEQGKPGRVALGDIGYVGYKTNYPVLDLLGLVDPVINQLPGGYTKKTGPGYADHFYDVMPEWPVLIFTGNACKDTSPIGAVKEIVEDERFTKNYKEQVHFKVSPQAVWCIYKKKGF